MKAQEFKTLLDRYRAGESTAEENAWLEAWYMNYGKGSLPLEEQELLQATQQIWAKLNKEGSLYNEKNSFEVKKTRLWPRIAAAAAVLLVVGAGLFFFNRFASAPRHPDAGQDPALATNDIKPGGNKAYLTLANGKRLSLTDAAKGAIAKEAGIEITKTADGQVIYTSSDSGLHQDNGTALNTIETPKGGQYQIQLPDGSKVWLNAASKLIYPVSFTGRGQRKVELSGEAYFEITKNKLQPFVVNSKNQEVTVLGTHFNVNAYVDEPVIKTTLLEGLVSIAAAGLNKKLNPGYQAVNTGKALSLNKVDVNIAVAWKNKQFLFESEDIQTIMRMIERWYNVEVIYTGDITTDKFSGGVSRFDQLSKVLKSLELAGAVHFKIDGRKLYVSK